MDIKHELDQSFEQLTHNAQVIEQNKDDHSLIIELRALEQIQESLYKHIANIEAIADRTLKPQIAKKTR